MKCFACPLSGQELRHPCPIHRCPANLAHTAPEQSCAYVLPDTSYETLAPLLDTEPSDLRHRSQDQIAALGDLMRDIDTVLNAPLRHSCPNCGYITPCASSTVCGERKAAADEILVKVEGEGGSLKPAHIWYSLLSGRDRFLTQEQRDRLFQLVNQKHMRKTDEHAS